MIYRRYSSYYRRSSLFKSGDGNTPGSLSYKSGTMVTRKASELPGDKTSSSGNPFLVVPSFAARADSRDSTMSYIDPLSGQFNMLGTDLGGVAPFQQKLQSESKIIEDDDVFEDDNKRKPQYEIIEEDDVFRYTSPKAGRRSKSSIAPDDVFGPPSKQEEYKSKSSIVDKDHAFGYGSPSVQEKKSEARSVDEDRGLGGDNEQVIDVQRTPRPSDFYHSGIWQGFQTSVSRSSSTCSNANSFPAGLDASRILTGAGGNVRSTMSSKAQQSFSGIPPPPPPSSPPNPPRSTSQDFDYYGHPDSDANRAHLRETLKSHLPKYDPDQVSTRAKDREEYLKANPKVLRQDYVHPSDKKDCLEPVRYRKEIYKVFLREYPKLWEQPGQFFDELNCSILAVKKGLLNPAAWRDDIRKYIAKRSKGYLQSVVSEARIVSDALQNNKPARYYENSGGRQRSSIDPKKKFANALAKKRAEMTAKALETMTFEAFNSQSSFVSTKDHSAHERSESCNGTILKHTGDSSSTIFGERDARKAAANNFETLSSTNATKNESASFEVKMTSAAPKSSGTAEWAASSTVTSSRDTVGGVSCSSQQSDCGAKRVEDLATLSALRAAGVLKTPTPSASSGAFGASGTVPKSAPLPNDLGDWANRPAVPVAGVYTSYDGVPIASALRAVERLVEVAATEASAGACTTTTTSRSATAADAFSAPIPGLKRGPTGAMFWDGKTPLPDAYKHLKTKKVGSVHESKVRHKMRMNLLGLGGGRVGAGASSFTCTRFANREAEFNAEAYLEGKGAFVRTPCAETFAGESAEFKDGYVAGLEAKRTGIQHSDALAFTSGELQPQFQEHLLALRKQGWANVGSGKETAMVKDTTDAIKETLAKLGRETGMKWGGETKGGASVSEDKDTGKGKGAEKNGEKKAAEDKEVTGGEKSGEEGGEHKSGGGGGDAVGGNNKNKK